jgi:hypothetical protein
MKTVRYMAGAAAGLFPVAALGVTGTANAAELTHVPRTAVKNVRHVWHPDIFYSYNQCRGVTPARNTNGDMSIHFWYHRSGPTTCIGTVVGFDRGNYANVFRVRLWVSGTLALSSRAPAVYHQKVFGSSVTGSITLRVKTVNNPQVCGAFLSVARGHSTLVAPAACYTL